MPKATRTNSTKRSSGKGAFNVKDWAKKQARNYGGRGCACCRNDIWRKVVDEIVEAVREGADPAVPQIHALLRDRYGFKQGQSSLHKHMRQHTDWFTAREAPTNVA